METLRLSGFALALFVAAFLGISWANRDAPPAATSAAPTPPGVSTPVAELVAVSTPVAEPVAIPASQPIRSTIQHVHEDSDPRRQALRLAALRAASDFETAPCDPAVKRALVTALTNYAKAWTDVAGCKSGNCGGDHRLDKAGGAFSTPTDMRVRFALRAAFDRGGVGRDDFPPSLRLPVTMLIGDPGDPTSSCSTGRRAEATR